MKELTENQRKALRELEKALKAVEKSGLSLCGEDDELLWLLIPADDARCSWELLRDRNILSDTISQKCYSDSGGG